jgi:broad specificity phosphatase PhoE
MLEIVFIRNADGEDEDLSQEVKNQCRRAGRLLEELGLRPDLIITSDAPRSKRTGEFIAQGLKIPPSLPQRIEMPESRYFAPDQETYDAELRPIFKELGVDQPMSMYLRRDTKGIFLAQAQRVADKIRSEASARFGQRRTLVLVVGRHILQNLVGLTIAPNNPILMGPEFLHLTGYRIDEDGLVCAVDLST